MKTLKDLAKGDYIAFGFNYNGGEPNEIIVNEIDEIYQGKFLVVFLYGYKSLSKFVNKEDILAIGNDETGEAEIKNWSGKYDVLNQEEIDRILARR